MIWEPRNYQSTVSDSVLENTCYGLLLDPGLGKTSSILFALHRLKMLGMLRKTLIVAPLRVVQCVWGQEIEKWDNFELSYQQISANSPAKREKNMEVEADVYGINPESLIWLLEHNSDFLEDFDTIVFDESTKFKNPASKRFKTMKKHLHRFDARYILTGTPIPNGLEDLWSQIYLLDEGERLGKNITRFRQKYFMAINRGVYNDYVIKPGAEEEIYEAIADITVRMSEKDYLDLPEMIYNTVPVELDKPVLKQYKDLEKDFFAYLEGDGEDVVAVNAAVAAGKCRQFASGGIFKNQDIFAGEYGDPKEVLHIHDHKTKAVEDLVEDLGGSPVMIAYEFKHDLERLKKAFPRATVFAEERDVDKVVDRWNEGRIPILLCQPQSMGHGLNMQGSGNNIIWYSISWNLELFDQFNKRIHRPGQEKPCYIHLIVANKTIDESVVDLLTMKSNNQTSFLDALHKYKRSTV